MVTYWDLSDKERAALTETEVQQFLDAELMVKGVLKAVPPTLEPVEDVEYQTETYYEVGGKSYYGGLLFAKLLDAECVAAMNPCKSAKDYDLGDNVLRLDETQDMKVVSVQVLGEQEYVRVKAALKKSAEAKSRNKELVAAYDKATAEQRKVLAGVWEDWREKGRMAVRHEKIKATREEYLKMCGGDAALAEKFLRKTFTEDDVQESDEWFGTPHMIIVDVTSHVDEDQKLSLVPAAIEKSYVPF